MSLNLPAEIHAPVHAWRILEACSAVRRLNALARRRLLPSPFRRRFYKAKRYLTKRLRESSFFESVELQTLNGIVLEFYTFNVDGACFRWHVPQPAPKSDRTYSGPTVEWKPKARRNAPRPAPKMLPPGLVDEIAAGIEFIERVSDELGMHNNTCP